MSLEKAESYLKEAGFLDHVIELKESTATVALAAAGRDFGRFHKHGAVILYSCRSIAP